MRLSGFALSLFICAASDAPAADAPAPQWVVVVAPAFRDAVQPLLDHRKAPGFPDDARADDRHTLRRGTPRRRRPQAATSCEQTLPRPRRAELRPAGRARSWADKPEEAERTVVPPLDGGVGRMKGQPSDNGYGCLERRPSAVRAGRPISRTDGGRSPANGAENAGLRRRRPAGRVAASADDAWPEFPPTTRWWIAWWSRWPSRALDRLDPSWTGRAVYSNPQSRFCPPDDELQSVAMKVCRRRRSVDALSRPLQRGRAVGRRRPYLDRDDWAQLKIRRGAGVFATFGCNGCQLIGKRGEGYGVAAMRNPDGPVAVIGSHGICFAAMVQLATDGLIRQHVRRTDAGAAGRELAGDQGAAWPRAI